MILKWLWYWPRCLIFQTIKRISFFSVVIPVDPIFERLSSCKPSFSMEGQSCAAETDTAIASHLPNILLSLFFNINSYCIYICI